MKVIAIDFDGVVRTSKGELIQKGKDMIEKLYDSGDSCIIIYTSRADVPSQYEYVRNFLVVNNIKYHAIKLGKVRYDLLIDDKVELFKEGK